MSKKNPARYVPGIYTITNTVTGAVYVGQAIDIGRRWKAHRWGLKTGAHRNTHLLRSWQKHGKEAFVFAVARDMSHIPADELYAALAAAEVEVLSEHPDNYNLMEAGQIGVVASQETRELLSSLVTKRWTNQAFREKQSAAIKALYENVEWKAARDAAVQIGRNTPESKAKSSSRFLRMWQNPEHQATQSAKRKANWQDPEYRAQQHASRKAAAADPEVRRRRSEGLKAAHARRRAAKLASPAQPAGSTLLP